MIPEVDAKQLSEKLTGATLRVARDYANEDVVDEESFSGQLCGRLKETIYRFETHSLVWQLEADAARGGHGRLAARSLGKSKEEPQFGADLIMVIEATTPTYEVRKGFLAQAKRLEPGKKLRVSEYNELREQCRKMLTYTPSSMVFLYSTKDVHVVSANAIVASRQQDLWSVPTWGIDILYYDFAICWLGDTRLKTTARRTFEELRAAMDTQAGLHILGSPKIA